MRKRPFSPSESAFCLVFLMEKCIICIVCAFGSKSTARERVPSETKSRTLPAIPEPHAWHKRKAPCDAASSIRNGKVLPAAHAQPSGERMESRSFPSHCLTPCKKRNFKWRLTCPASLSSFSASPFCSFRRYRSVPLSCCPRRFPWDASPPTRRRKESSPCAIPPRRP